MTRHATRILGLLCLGAGALGLMGCREVMFSHAVAGDVVDPTPFLGAWTVGPADGGDPGEPCNAVITIDEGEVRLRLSQGGVVTEKTAALTQIGATTVLSLDLGEGFWSHSAAVFEDGGNRLWVSGPDLDAVKSEILEGTLAGEIDVVDMTSELVFVDSDAASLSARILDNPALFGSPSFVLTKQ
ncbi:MAG: hypothetical protein GY722_27165 [bacterium]|nr:hypothetical protein [bacterium]